VERSIIWKAKDEKTKKKKRSRSRNTMHDRTPLRNLGAHLHSKLPNIQQICMQRLRTVDVEHKKRQENERTTEKYVVVESSRAETFPSFSVYIAKFIRHLDPSKRCINHRNTEAPRNMLVSFPNSGFHRKCFTTPRKQGRLRNIGRRA